MLLARSAVAGAAGRRLLPTSSSAAAAAWRRAGQGALPALPPQGTQCTRGFRVTATSTSNGGTAGGGSRGRGSLRGSFREQRMPLAFNDIDSRPPSRLVLGIESSCDDTGAAVVSSTGEILGEALATQAEIHAPWGGVVPKLAQEAHERAIDDVVEKALERAGVSGSDIEAVAVTIGPGLSLCLRVGVLKARSVSHAHQLPIIPVHHMEAHALVARCTNRDDVQFPFLCLLVSGGHNLLMVVRGVGNYLQVGSTLDDALGEAYDKIARMLGLDMRPNGGAALELIAREGNPKAYKFPIPLRKRPNCDFSYAGLKTSVRLAIEELVGEPSEANRQVRADIAASFQYAAVRHLAERTRRAAAWAREEYPEIQTLVVAGGVASNTYVRDTLSSIAADAGLQLVCPPARLCTDNGVMVAWAGIERMQMGLMEPPAEAAAPAEGEWVDLRPRWALTDEKDSRCAPTLKSSRKVKLHAPLFQSPDSQGAADEQTAGQTPS